MQDLTPGSRAPDKTHTYTLTMGYDSIHNIVSKNQLHTVVQPSGTPITQKKTTYNWTYAYNASGPTSTRPHAPTHIGERTYTYDLNGNQTGWTHDQNGTQRTIVWDEENRIQTLFDNGHEKAYKYDDQGNRTLKRGPQGETVYVNQFYTQRPGANGTKHVYAGTSRIASKLLRQDVPGANPAGKTPYEKDLYFYHPDHLGNSSYVTDLNGKLYEHLQYFPFGEAWVEENSNAQRTPYHFTSKELDEETGLYYFGARYYDPRTSVWQSADPILGKYLDGEPNGGINVPGTLNLYAYGFQNPVRFKDEEGEFVNFIIGAGIGAALDVGVQVALIASGQQKKFSVTSVLVSAGAGAIGVGIAANAARVSNLALKVGAEVAGDATVSAVSKAVKGEEVTVGGVVADVVAGQAGGKALGKVFKDKAAGSPEAKLLDKAANRAERIAANPKVGRPEARARQAGEARDAYKGFLDDAEIRGGAVGSNFGQKALEIVNPPSKDDK